MRDRTGWKSLGEWILALGLAALAVIGAASIGMFVLPFAIVAMVFALRRNRAWPEAPLGGVIGVGFVCLFVAYRNRAYAPCPPEGIPVRLNSVEHLACRGLNPIPWLTIGVLVAALGVVGYVVFRRTHGATAAT